MNDKCDDDEYICAELAARMLGLSPKTLANWRSSGKKKLRFYKSTGRVMYKRTEVREFRESCSATSTAQIRLLSKRLDGGE